MILNAVKRALDISDTDFDEELIELIEQAKADLLFTSIRKDKIVEDDPNIKRAIIGYCKMNFGNVDEREYAKLERAYNEHKAQLSMRTAYCEE